MSRGPFHLLLMVNCQIFPFIVELLFHAGHAVRGDLPENVGVELGPEGQFNIATDQDIPEAVADLMRAVWNETPKDGALVSLSSAEGDMTSSNKTREGLNRNFSALSSQSKAPREISPQTERQVVSKFEDSSSATNYENKTPESMHRRRYFHDPGHALSQQYGDGMRMLPKASVPSDHREQPITLKHEFTTAMSNMSTMTESMRRGEEHGPQVDFDSVEPESNSLSSLADVAHQDEVLRSKLQAKRAIIPEPTLRKAQIWKDWLEKTPYPELRGVTPEHSHLIQLAAMSMNVDSFLAPGFDVEAAPGFPANSQNFPELKIKVETHELSTATGRTKGWFRHDDGGPDKIYYYVNKEEKWAAIVFSGTTNQGNVRSNLSIRLTEAKHLEHCTNVAEARWHSGLADEWTRMAQDEKVKKYLRKLSDLKDRKNYKVWAAGHSLGAMLATVCAYCRGFNLASFGGAVVGTTADGGPIDIAGLTNGRRSETWRFVHEYEKYVDFVSWIGNAMGGLEMITPLERIFHPTMRGKLGGVYKINVDGFVRILPESDAYWFPGLKDMKVPRTNAFLAHLPTGYMHSINKFVELSKGLGDWVKP